MNTNRKMRTSIAVFKKFGINKNSLSFLLKRKKANEQEIIKFSSKKLAQPIFMNAKNAYFTPFDQIFLSEDYAIDFPVAPKVIFDCGANIGFASVWFKTKFPEAKVFAIEPADSNFELLKKNTEKLKGVSLYKAGLWSKKTNLCIENPEADEISFIVKETSEATENTIPAVSIEQIMKENDIDCIDVLKIDIECSEKEVFASNYEYWLPRTKCIIIELHDRIQPGCSKSFFDTISKYNFGKIQTRGENTICFAE
jgi:FkbM family methyltransferase